MTPAQLAEYEKLIERIGEGIAQEIAFEFEMQDSQAGQLYLWSRDASEPMQVRELKRIWRIV